MTDEEKKERLTYLERIKCVHPEKCLYKISCRKDYERMWHGATQEKKCLDFVKQHLNNVIIGEGLKTQVLEAVENPENSEFPDFTLNNGFIEHFQITASTEDNKGSEYKRTEAEHQRELNIAPQGASLSPKHSGWSYDNLKKSFKRNWMKHLESLSKYSTRDIDITTKVFMLEHVEMNFEMFENVCAYTDDHSMEQRHFFYYSLSHDIEMLDYMYNFCDKIDYVIYRHMDGVEIIELAKIPKMKESLKFPFIISPLFQMRFSTVGLKWTNNDLICFHSQN